MKIYLNSYIDKRSGKHRGCEYYDTKDKAVAAASNAIDDLIVKTRRISVAITKKGILAALNKYGESPYGY